MRWIALLSLALARPARALPSPDGPDVALASAVFFRLAAAGFPDGQMSMIVAADRHVNALYSDDRRAVVVFDGLLKAHPGDEAVLVFVLSHELGHALQARDDAEAGHPAERDGPPGPAEKRLEAQADLLGEQLAKAAGYAPEEYDAGVRRFFGCASKVGDLLVRWLGSHPTDADRCVNVIAYAAAADSRREAESLERVHAKIFSDDGRVLPHLLVPAGAKAALIASVYRDPREGLPSDPAAPVRVNPSLVAARNNRLNKAAPAAVDAALDRLIEPPDALARARSPASAEAMRRSISSDVAAAAKGDTIWFKARARRLGLMAAWPDVSPR